MAEKKTGPGLFPRRGIHSFVVDAAVAQVYRPQSWDFPLSRRPRDAFELRADGTAQLFLPGAQDRPVSHRESDRLVVIENSDPMLGAPATCRPLSFIHAGDLRRTIGRPDQILVRLTRDGASSR